MFVFQMRMCYKRQRLTGQQGQQSPEKTNIKHEFLSFNPIKNRIKYILLSTFLSSFSIFFSKKIRTIEQACKIVISIIIGKETVVTKLNLDICSKKIQINDGLIHLRKDKKYYKPTNKFPGLKNSFKE